MEAFTPTREAGLERLRAWLPRAGRYAAERNHVRAGHENVSRLSPWLQKRLVTEEEVAAAVLGDHAFATVEKFVQEVTWRTYWKGWLEQRPAAWTRWRDGVRRAEDGMGAETRSRWEAAIAGRTGLACFDAWATELRATGWLHNHVRMWFASIWIFTLRLPWELGAAFFWAYLKDGDAASNTLSWRWVAGLQTAGKTYLARPDNIARYTGGRFEPRAGELATEAVALTEVEGLPREPLWDAPAGGADDAGQRVGWWVLPDDLGPRAETAAGPEFGAWPRGFGEVEGWSADVERWTRAALVDRVGDVRDEEDVGAAVAAWATREKLDEVRAWRPLVGPWAEVGRQGEARLRDAGVRVTWRRREWDAVLFPAATRGFFPFWQRAAKVVRGRAEAVDQGEWPLFQKE